MKQNKVGLGNRISTVHFKEHFKYTIKRDISRTSFERYFLLLKESKVLLSYADYDDAHLRS